MTNLVIDSSESVEQLAAKIDQLSHDEFNLLKKASTVRYQRELQELIEKQKEETVKNNSSVSTHSEL